MNIANEYYINIGMTIEMSIRTGRRAVPNAQIIFDNFDII
jgi:hypothetical protein